MKVPTGTLPGSQSLKFTPSPVTFEISDISTAVNEVTTVANAPPMMNATASSTRLPRMMNSLNPLSMTATLSGDDHAQEGRRSRAGDRPGRRVGDGEDHQRAGRD